jgi:hypothetical protein
MFGPGAYRPDPTAGMTAIADLPQPEIVPYSRNDIRNAGPRCGHVAYRDKQARRPLHDLGHLDLGCPRALVITYAQHYCPKGRKYFNADLSDLAPPGSHYTQRVLELAVRRVGEDGLPYRPARWHLGRAHRVFVPCATSQHGVEVGGKKVQARMDTDCLAGALADFAGSMAADAVAAGPFGMLGGVDNRRSTRLLDDVLEHAPDPDAIRAVCGRLKTA